MATLRQVLANRANALKSTGPVSAQGKAVVARNAVKHGVFSDELLVEGDDPAELEEFHASLLADIAPVGASQRMLAERIISASWRLKRLSSAEVQLHQSIADSERDGLCDEFDGEPVAYPGEEEDLAAVKKARYGSRAKGRLEDLAEQRRQDWAKQQLCPAGLTLAIDLEREQSVIDRFSRYEKRLEGTIHRAWRELRLLRKEGRGDTCVAQSTPDHQEEEGEASLAPTPRVSPVENVQNKPNSPASDQPAEVYAEAKAQPVHRVILRKLPGADWNVKDDATT